MYVLFYFREEKTEALAEAREELEQTNLTAVKLKEEVHHYSIKQMYLISFNDYVCFYCFSFNKSK